MFLQIKASAKYINIDKLRVVDKLTCMQLKYIKHMFLFSVCAPALNHEICGSN